MKRKTFIRWSSLIAATPLVESVTAFAQQQQRLKNWAGNFEFSTANVKYPSSLKEAQALVRPASDFRVLGTRHCFNRIADSKHELVSTSRLNKVISLDASAKTVTVEGGIKYGELAPYLHEHGFALHNLASLPHISVGGSCSTGTHGSGVENGNLSSQVRSLQIIRPDGSTTTLTRGTDDSFNGTVVSLGALGLISRLTLDVRPTFMMKQRVFQMLPLSELRGHFNEVMSSGYSVSLFTDWKQESINEVWIKSLASDTHVDGQTKFFGAAPAGRNLHPIASLSSENCTEQMGVPGPWYERLPHFKMGFTPSSGKELQSEFFIPYEHAVDGIMAIQRLGHIVSPHLLISEVRTIAADELWISPCYRQKSVTIHFTWKPDWPAVRKILPLIEKALDPFGVRPHWGKLFTLSPEVLVSRYNRFGDFKKLVSQFDPQKKLQNDFLKPFFS